MEKGRRALYTRKKECHDTAGDCRAKLQQRRCVRDRGDVMEGQTEAGVAREERGEEKGQGGTFLDKLEVGQTKFQKKEGNLELGLRPNSRFHSIARVFRVHSGGAPMLAGRD